MKEKQTINLSIALALTVLAAGALSGCSGNSPAAKMRQARQFEHKGAYRKAAIELKEVVKEQPGNVSARLLLGKVSLQLGEPIYAQQQFEQAEKRGASSDSVLPLLADSLLGQGESKKLLKTVQIFPSQSSALQAKLFAARGQALLQLGKRKAAAAAFDRALHLVPEQPRALIGQAELALLKNDLAAAGQKLDAALKKNPTAMRAWVLKGNIAFQKKQLASAAADYRRAIKAPIQSESPFEKFVARGRLATILIQEKKDGEALEVINAMLKEAPQQPLPNYLRAVLAYREKHYNLAAEKLQIVLKGAPNNPNAQGLLGMIKERQGENEQAQMYLTGALSADPSNPDLVLALANLQLRMGNPDRALSTLNNAVGRGVSTPTVMRLLENTIMSVAQASQGLEYLRSHFLPEATNPGVQMSLAKAFISRGLDERAVSLLKKVQPSGEDAEAQKEELLVTALLAGGHKSGALRVARAAVSKHPNGARWHNLLGNLYVSLKRNDAARAQFLAARRLNPENAMATLSLASLALREQKFHEAINDLGYLHGNSGRPSAMILEARAYAGLKQHKKAVAILQEATQKYPDSPAPLLILVRYELGNHQPQIAKTQVEQALAHHPENAGLLNLLGLTQIVLKANQDAVQSFSKAAKEAPTNIKIRLNLAHAQIAANQIADAIRTLSGLRSAHPDNVAVLDLLAFAQMRNKQPKAAFAIAKAMQEKSSLKVQGNILEGRLFEAQHKYGNAALAFERAAHVSGNGAVLALAVTAREKGHINPPEKPLLDWVHQHEGSPNVTEIALLAQWYTQHNDLPQAAFWYRKVTEGHESYVPFMLNNLAMVYLMQHDSRALPTAQRAYRLAPHFAAVADTLGWIQFRAGDLRGAAIHLNQAVSEDPGNPDMRYHLASLLAKSGKKGEALKELNRALKTKGSFYEKPAAEALKEQLHG